MSKLNRLAGALLVLMLVGGIGGGTGKLIASQQVTACSQAAHACE